MTDPGSRSIAAASGASPSADASSPLTVGTGRQVGDMLQAATERLRASGSGSARLDAELLLAHVLGVERTSVLAHPEAALGESALERFLGALERRASGEPVAYIRGVKEFHGIALSVDPRALIPRPETEILVDHALAHVRARLTEALVAPDAPPFLVWDVGTGSGAIAVALGVELRRLGYGSAVRFHLSDVSADALGLAMENAVAHGLADRMTFSTGDLLDAHPGRPADLIVANLPYIPAVAVPGLPIAAHFEPRLALDGGDDGVSVIRRLFDDLPDHLGPHGRAYLEFGADQADALAATVGEALPGWTLHVHRDLAGDARVAQLDPPA